MDAIFTRTSIRKFEDKEVEQEKIEKLLRAGMQAPTAANQQPWEFYVVKDKDILTRISETTPYAGPAKNAPMAIVIVSRADSMVPLYNDIDCAIATESIMIEAVQLGLGSVMLGIAPIKDRMEAVGEILGLPENLNAFTILPIGYPVNVNPQQDRYDETRVHYI